MSKSQEIMKNVDAMEKAFRFHGLWGRPYIPPPQIPLREDWSEDIHLAAEALNKIFFIRSLPTCSRLFGPVRESQIQAFLQDCTTPSERVNYARNQANLLLADLKLVRGLDLMGLDRISE